MKAALEPLYTIGTSLLRELSSSMHPDAAMMFKLVLKCYHGAIQVYQSYSYRVIDARQNELPKILQEEKNLSAWLTLFYQAAMIKIPADMSLDIDERGKNTAFKVKKWAFRGMLRLFSRYGNTTTDSFRDQTYNAFSKHFMQKHATDVMTSLLSQIERNVGGEWLPEKILSAVVGGITDG